MGQTVLVPAKEGQPKPQLREKLMRLGPVALQEAELLSLILGSGSRGQPVEELAQRLLLQFGGMEGLVKASCTQLVSESGLGLAGACRLVAAFTLARRWSEGKERPAIRQPEDVFREVRDLAVERREHLVGLYLDAQSRLIARETVAIGSLNVARALPRDLLEPALRHLATGFVLVHNHPSGIAEPSEDDIRFTRTVGRAACLLGLTLHDHLVVAKSGHASLRSLGLEWEGLP